MTSSGTDPRDAANGGPQGWPLAGASGQTGAHAAPAGSAAPAGQGPSTASTASTAQPPAAPGERRERQGSGGGRRRPPLWVLVVAAVVVVGLVVAGVVLLNRGGGDGDATPEAEVVTLPVPTPTVEPVAREAGTAFYDALPSTVLAHALSESGEQAALLQAGAVEGYRLVYTDGQDPVVLVAGQFETPEAAASMYGSYVEALTALVAQAGGSDAGDGAEGAEGTEGAEDSADADADAASTDVEEGAVTLTDGTEVGRYTLIPRGDGTGTLTWWNGTVVLQLDGPSDQLLDLFTAFPL